MQISTRTRIDSKYFLDVVLFKVKNKCILGNRIQTLLLDGLLELDIYGDLVCIFKELIGSMIFCFSSEKSLHVTDVYVII